ncbi:MAG: hypothetical protein RJA35_75 [Actinomycetota bacterium]|jgi:hypothetical protein
MDIKAQAERQGDAWVVTCPELDNFTATSKRLDKAEELIKALASKQLGESICDIVVTLDAVMPGIVCDIEKAQAKMVEATKLQEQASTEIRDVVRRAREQGLTMRDIAVLLNVTPQRVAQLCDC